MENQKSRASSRLYRSLALLMIALLAVIVLIVTNGIARRGEAPKETSRESIKESVKESVKESAKESAQSSVKQKPETRLPILKRPEEGTGEVDARESTLQETTLPESASLESRLSDSMAEESTVTPTVAELRFVQPTAGYVVKFHDLETPVYSFTMEDWRCHRGVDISASVGSEVKACAAGVIAGIGADPMMGETVMIDHGNGLISTYRNLSPEHPAGIVEGARVEAGQCIGGVGESALVEISDASHLHFEMTLGGIDIDPLDYIDYELILEE